MITVDGTGEDGLGMIEDGYVLVRDGRFEAVGRGRPGDDKGFDLSEYRVVDCAGAWSCPGWSTRTAIWAGWARPTGRARSSRACA
ncbi:MAG: hypothetical protein AAF108_11025 [Planctomycetota bacterium]